MSNSYFACRQFSVRQDRCAMKVSTDACIFGAWVPIGDRDRRILDIGTGTGLLALMLAQRSASGRFDAIELDGDAAIQAGQNAADSVFADRIRVLHQDARDFRSETRYDLIVSNPPFFSKSLKGPDGARNRARHSDTLSLQELFLVAAQHLADDGRFAILMPYDLRQSIFECAESVLLNCAAELIIRDQPHSAPNRGCWIFQRGQQSAIDSAALDIRDGGRYSDAFTLLLRPYYLLL